MRTFGCWRGTLPALLGVCYVMGAIGLAVGLCFIAADRIWMHICSIPGTVIESCTRFLISSKACPVHKMWPPENTSELFCSDLGTYSMSLKPWVDTGNKIRNPELSYIHLLKALSNQSEIMVSDLEQLVLLDTRHRVDGIHQNLQLYPKVVDLHAIVSAIRSGKPVDQEPLSDPEMLIIQAPKMSCGNLDGTFLLDQRSYTCDLIVMVKSCVNCQSERTHARLTYMQKTLWTGVRVEFVFVVGLPFISNSSTYKVDDVEVPSGQHVKTKQELKQQEQALFEESRAHNDILVGGFIDTYENLTTKVIFALRWASAFCKHCSPLFMLMDNDLSLVPENFMKLLKNLPYEAKNEIIGGLPYFFPRISRPTGRLKDHRHALDRKHYPWDNAPTYLYGGGYLLGSEKVRDVAIASAYVRRIKMEDVFLGMIWEKLGYECLKLPGFLLSPSSAFEIASSVLASTTFADRHVDWKTGKIGWKKKSLKASK